MARARCQCEEMRNGAKAYTTFFSNTFPIARAGSSVYTPGP